MDLKGLLKYDGYFETDGLGSCLMIPFDAVGYDLIGTKGETTRSRLIGIVEDTAKVRGEEDLWIKEVCLRPQPYHPSVSWSCKGFIFPEIYKDLVLKEILWIDGDPAIVKALEKGKIKVLDIKKEDINPRVYDHQVHKRTGLNWPLLLLVKPEDRLRLMEEGISLKNIKELQARYKHLKLLLNWDEFLEPLSQQQAVELFRHACTWDGLHRFLADYQITFREERFSGSCLVAHKLPPQQLGRYATVHGKQKYFSRSTAERGEIVLDEQGVRWVVLWNSFSQGDAYYPSTHLFLRASVDAFSKSRKNVF